MHVLRCGIAAPVAGA